ncbi:hypothetical protein K1T71_007538 [Dendrolimus kikuchii]|uniref:Uncharacterized protein n=1 Tax=Dendrolimus kikuchii TaxID=765133 RepID=A0ACC1CXC3_9NEOP|nr:hypothetical protein K1T71_007538 [Dendrolimus kikuchii]
MAVLPVPPARDGVHYGGVEPAQHARRGTKSKATPATLATRLLHTALRSGISIKPHYTILGLKLLEQDEDISYCWPNLFDGGNGEGSRSSSPPCHQLRIRRRPRRHSADNAIRRPGVTFLGHS